MDDVLAEAGFVLLASPIDGTPWACPPGAVEAWKLRGWLPCPEPAAPVDPPKTQPAKSTSTSKTTKIEE